MQRVAAGQKARSVMLKWVKRFGFERRSGRSHVLRAEKRQNALPAPNVLCRGRAARSTEGPDPSRNRIAVGFRIRFFATRCWPWPATKPSNSSAPTRSASRRGIAGRQAHGRAVASNTVAAEPPPAVQGAWVFNRRMTVTPPTTSSRARTTRPSVVSAGINITMPSPACMRRVSVVAP